MTKGVYKIGYMAEHFAPLLRYRKEQSGRGTRKKTAWGGTASATNSAPAGGDGKS